MCPEIVRFLKTQFQKYETFVESVMEQRFTLMSAIGVDFILTGIVDT